MPVRGTILTIVFASNGKLKIASHFPITQQILILTELERIGLLLYILPGATLRPPRGQRTCSKKPRSETTVPRSVSLCNQDLLELIKSQVTV